MLGATALGLLAFFGFLVLRAVEPPYALLYGGMALEDSAQIVSRLEALGVPFRLQGDGEAILVPADQALRLRMTLAEEGLPRGGAVGDEIFDQIERARQHRFLENVNLRRALEGELARTIASIAGVRSARVHLVLPEHELFRRDRVEPSASIALLMHGGRRLDRRQVLAVQHLVAAAVPNLLPERITVVDDQGTCSRAAATAPRRAPCPPRRRSSARPTRRASKQTIEELLERSLGPGRVQAEVSADLDFDQVTTTEETFDPDGQVVRSTQTVEEKKQSSERDNNTSVSVGNNLPNAGADTPASGRANADNSTRTDETINYEISRRVRNQTQVGGQVRRLSVAVLVDGKMAPERGRRAGLCPTRRQGARPDREPGPLGDRLRCQARRRGRGEEPPVHRASTRRGASRPGRADRVRRHAASGNGRAGAGRPDADFARRASMSCTGCCRRRARPWPRAVRAARVTQAACPARTQVPALAPPESQAGGQESRELDREAPRPGPI